MSARHDWAAIGPRGVYALLDAQLATKDEVVDFHEDVTRRGHRIELLPVEEAVRRHRAYLGGSPAEWDLPSVLPSAEQMEMFG